MNNLLDAKFQKFVDDFNLQDESKEKNWKRFVNYQFFSQLQPGRFDTDQDLLDQICVDSQQFPAIQGAVFFLNEQILSEPQDVDDILQRDGKGLLELYFLTFDTSNNFEKQLEYLFHNLESMDIRQTWLEILKYVTSSEVVLHWTNNPVLNVVVYSDNGNNKKEIINDEIGGSFSDIKNREIDKKSLLDIVKFHADFELIHPFQDGNGRVGRLILFRESLINELVPPIIVDKDHTKYIYAIREAHQENYKRLLEVVQEAQAFYLNEVKYFMEF